ncbi:MAG: SpoIID/LytB domain-containing protein [Planctomycetes bacterium]|nr:SpoIID/LytB domain-containing protein [Planctomycetota bacterium]
MPASPPPSRLLLFLGLLTLIWGGSLLLDRQAPPGAPLPGGLADPDPLVLVRLERFAGGEALELGIRGRWRVVDDLGNMLHEGHGLDAPVRIDSGGYKVGPWRVRADSFWIEPEGDDALVLDQSRYHGRLRFELKRDRLLLPESFDVLLELPLEAYVLGVVCGELPTLAEGAAEALKAQAVAARSYALWRLRGGRRSLSDSPSDQRFRSIDWVTDEARRAVNATQGLVLVWDRALLPAWYHANCGGGTANAAVVGFSREEIRPLAGVPDPICAAGPVWERAVGPEVLDRIAVRDGLGDSFERMVLRERDVSGRLISAVLVGQDATLGYRGEDLRRDFGLPSTFWSSLRAVQDGSLVVRGTGRGHGVGMCQDGALRLSREGRAFQEILGRYYPGAGLSSLADLDRTDP